MTAMVALLRAVNVGGRSLPMAELRTIVEGCGHTGVRTYIQSGNVVFEAASKNGEQVARGLEQAIGEATGVTTEVTVRTGAELADLLDHDPFAGEDPAFRHVVFRIDTGPAPVPAIDEQAFLPEAVRPYKRELVLHLPNGMGRAKLPLELARRSKERGTARNWRTVTKLAELAGAR
jgi:uncharacterized protein (DUF1697 family)